jgi:hypothetical protein
MTKPTETKPAPGKPKTPFARFFSSVEGHLVSRYGTASQQRANTLIGALRKTSEPSSPLAGTDAVLGTRPPWQTFDLDGAVTWYPSEVVAISQREAELFRREYDRAVKNGALRERTEDDYLAFVKASKELAEKTQKEIAAAASEAEAAADVSDFATARTTPATSSTQPTPKFSKE